jgi:hypothetical protein
MCTFKKCTKKTSVPLVKVGGRGKVAIFKNGAKAAHCVTEFDGCVDTGGTKRADYIVSQTGLVNVITELKGKNITEAGQQVIATKDFMKSEGLLEPHVGALIVSSKVPLGVSSVQELALQLRKAGINRLRIKNRVWCGEIGEFVA